MLYRLRIPIHPFEIEVSSSCPTTFLNFGEISHTQNLHHRWILTCSRVRRERNEKVSQKSSHFLEVLHTFQPTWLLTGIIRYPTKLQNGADCVKRAQNFTSTWTTFLSPSESGRKFVHVDLIFKVWFSPHMSITSILTNVLKARRGKE